MDLKDELASEISSVLLQNWDVRAGRLLVESELAVEGGVRVDATVLCANLFFSSKLVTDFEQVIAAKAVRVFLRCMSRLIAVHGGAVAEFDGSRIKGVFVGDMRNTNAATCALEMNYVASKMIAPKIKEYCESQNQAVFNISHGVGVDTSSLMAIRAGLRGANDIVWVGRAPNIAGKLCEIKDELYHSYLTEDVFFMLFDSAKFSDLATQKLMWEETRFNYLGTQMKVYRSNWNWEP